MDLDSFQNMLSLIHSKIELIGLVEVRRKLKEFVESICAGPRVEAEIDPFGLCTWRHRQSHTAGWEITYFGEVAYRQFVEYLNEST